MGGYGSGSFIQSAPLRNEQRKKHCQLADGVKFNPFVEPMDVFGLLLASDAFPPTIFNARLPVAWTPTVELTVHIRAVPEPGWLRCRFSTRFISGGMLEEDGEIWDPSEDKRYSSNMELKGDLLVVEGCILFLCRGQDWTRAN